MALSYQDLFEKPRFRDDFIRQLQLDKIIDDLIEKRLISQDEYIHLYSQRPDDRSAFLLDCFRRKNENDCKQFMQFLKHLEEFRKFVEEIENELDDMELRKAFILGGFPEIPKNYVVRTSLTNEIHDKILSLKWGEKLVVHGMTGYGKSCLVAKVLYNKELMQKFDYCLFWLNLREHQNIDNVLAVMWRLYCNIIILTDEIPLAHCPKEIDELKDCLKRVFLHVRLKNALLILNDVIASEVVEAFDFKCRLIITTQDKDVVNQLNVSFVEVKTGFSLQESLELFKKSLDVNALCDEASNIHLLGKGFPMFMALISSFLLSSREEAINGKEIWEDLIKEFNDRPFIDGKTSDYTDKAINMCLNKLDPELRDRYFDLVVFDEDINIMPNVLENFWQVGKSEVRNIMSEFAKKSLIVPYYHKIFGSYIYGVHDLHLSYLKNRCPDIQQRHKKLISSYDKITNGDFSKLPNDNYILSYVGYHLRNAGLNDRFSIYFDLKFIEAKIKAVGYKDVLRDMKIYRSDITQNVHCLEYKLNDYIKFIENNGLDLYNFKSTDIVQFALHENQNSSVYDTALKFVDNNPEQLYLKLSLPTKRRKNLTFKLEEDITVACFIENNESVLIGTASGQIMKYNQEEKIDTFDSHKLDIISLQLSPNKRSFLSVSKDHTAKWWKFSCANSRNSFESTNGIPSPRLKQVFWESVHSIDEKRKETTTFDMREKDDFIVTAVFNENFSYTKQIATGSNRGQILIWDANNGHTIKSIAPRGILVNSILFLKTHIIFCCADDIFFYLHEEITFVSKCNNGDNLSVNYLFSIKGKDEIIAVADFKIVFWNFSADIKATFQVDYKINCAGICNDSKYLILGDDSHCISVYDVELKQIVNKLDTEHGEVRSLDVLYDEESSLMLIIALNNKTLNKYKILPQSQNMSILTSHWKEKLLLYTYVTTSNQMFLFRDCYLLDEIDAFESNINSVQFSTCGNNIVYGLENGDVKELNYKTKKIKNILKLNGPINYLCCFDDILVANTNDVLTVLFKEPKNFKLRNVPIKFTIYDNQLFVIDCKCGMKIVDLVVNYHDYVELFCGKTALAAEFYKNKFVALTTDCKVSIFNIEMSSKPKQIFELEEKAISFKFSPDGILLAAGLYNGKIVVLNLLNFEKIILELHESPVKYLEFSSDYDRILVSVGDQIAWWNLKKHSIITSENGSNIWNRKLANNNVPYLLACIKLQGAYVKFFSASKDFTKFLCADNESNIYLMEAS